MPRFQARKPNDIFITSGRRQCRAGRFFASPAPLLARHRMVNATVKTQLDSGTIHALALKTLTPAEAG